MEVYCELCNEKQENLSIPGDFGLFLWIDRDSNYNTKSITFLKRYDSKYDNYHFEINLNYHNHNNDNKIIKFQKTIEEIENQLYEEKSTSRNNNIYNLCDKCIDYMLKYGVIRLIYEDELVRFTDLTFEAPCDTCNKISLLNYCVSRYAPPSVTSRPSRCSNEEIYIVEIDKYYKHEQPHIKEYRIGYLADEFFKQKYQEMKQKEDEMIKYRNFMRVCEECFVAHQHDKFKTFMFSTYNFDNLVEELKSCSLKKCTNNIFCWCHCAKPFCNEHSRLCPSCNVNYLCKYCTYNDNKCIKCHLTKSLTHL